MLLWCRQEEQLARALVGEIRVGRVTRRRNLLAKGVGVTLRLSALRG
jgi:hypothetical protein